MTSPIRLMSYNQQWQQDFEQARSLVLWATDGWVHEVQHIGSTALADGIAQPIIDMVACLREMKGLNEAATLIEGLNYVRVASPQWCCDELTALLHKPRTGALTHTVLLVRHGGTAWRRSLAIRDWLSAHLGDWQHFQNLKREHHTTGCDAGLRYAEAKNDFFKVLEQQTQ